MNLARDGSQIMSDFDLKSIRKLLIVSGLSRLKIDFDNDHDLVNIEYVFRGTPGTRQITYQEIIDNLTIALPSVPVGQVIDDRQKLT